MNAIFSQVATHDTLHQNDALRRRYAESAYDRNVKYNGENQKTLKKLEDLLIGNKEPEPVESEQPKISQLGAGQVKQIAIPVGKTLEETIDLWRNVRSDAISVPDPTTADFQLAAKASSKIAHAEAQITLHNYATSEIERARTVEESEVAKIASMELPSKLDYELLKTQKRYEHAISSYSFHVQMKQQGFEIQLPSFYKVA